MIQLQCSYNTDISHCVINIFFLVIFIQSWNDSQLTGRILEMISWRNFTFQWRTRNTDSEYKVNQALHILLKTIWLACIKMMKSCWSDTEK